MLQERKRSSAQHSPQRRYLDRSHVVRGEKRGIGVLIITSKRTGCRRRNGREKVYSMTLYRVDQAANLNVNIPMFSLSGLYFVSRLFSCGSCMTEALPGQ